MDQRSARLAPEAPLRECEPNAVYAPQGLAEGISTLASEPIFAAILGTAGPPRFRRRRNGFGTLLHIILEQQVSIDAAAAMHRRLSGLCQPLAPEPFLVLDDMTLRACGFSRQKMDYARRLAQAVASGVFDFGRLEAAEDDSVLAYLVGLKGIGRWSAEIYLIFALGRSDIWPAADLDRLVGKYDAINIKLDKAGGLTEALELAGAATARGFKIMVGCMIGTSLAMAPAVLVAQQAAVVDLDAPLLLAQDRVPGLRYDGSTLYPPEPALWG